MKYIYNDAEKYLEIDQHRKNIVERMTYVGRDKWHYIKKVSGSIVKDTILTTAQARDVWYNRDGSRDSFRKEKMVGFKTSTF